MAVTFCASDRCIIQNISILIKGGQCTEYPSINTYQKYEMRTLIGRSKETIINCIGTAG